MVASGILIAFSDVLTTIRPKTQFSDGYFVLSMQKSPVQGSKSRKKEGLPPQVSAIFWIFGITVLR